MNRLFLRLLALLTLVVLGSGTLMAGLFDYRILPSENRQLEPLLDEAVAALATGIAQGRPPAAVFAEARPYVGDQLALLPRDVLGASRADRERMDRGETVVVSDGPQRWVWAPVAGTDRVVELVLLSHRSARTQWAALPTTRGHGRPATEAERAELDALDDARLAWHAVQLGGGRVLWRDDAGALRVLELPYFSNARELGTGLTLLGVALALLLSLLPFRHELLALDAGARRLREGDLAARIPVGPRPGPVGAVSAQVNAMADRLGALIDGHEELLRSVSHELQTPLARLLFALDALEEEPQRAPERIEGMRATVEEMRVLATEVLQFHRLGGEQDHLLEREPVDLVELAGDVALAFDGVTVEADDAPAFVRGDARLLYRALRNLVENAVVYATPPVLRVEPVSDGVVVCVDDAGAGVPAADRARIFEPFFRVDGSRARATGGTGLGLAIVHRIAERHGGTVTCMASPEGGARFRLALPA